MSFYTEVIRNSDVFDSTDRIDDPALLEDTTRAAVKTIIAQAADLYGIKLILFETYRSQARQTMLFKQGATKLKTVGTHHYGISCDLVKDVHGSPSWKGDFSFLGQLARHNGMIWGGNWGYPAKHHDFVDSDHIQRCPLSRQPGLFAGTWYPDAGYDPYSEL